MKLWAIYGSPGALKGPQNEPKWQKMPLFGFYFVGQDKIYLECIFLTDWYLRIAGGKPESNSKTWVHLWSGQGQNGPKRVDGWPNQPTD